MADLVVFWVLAPISVGSAVAMLVQRNAVHAALFLVVNLFTLAVFYLVLGAPFLFAVQIIVYAGAIVVLFLFVIMLLGVDRRESLAERLRGQRTLALLLGVGLVAEVAAAVRAGVGFSARFPGGFDAVNRGGNARALARVLFSDYFFPFEVTSVLLIVAAVAAMVLAARRAPAGSPAPEPGAEAAERAEAAP
ncbi:MAG TPA: NADH-quinone oxidoreductase subunit J [Actinomycetota bacterium]|nr:NADH-quinone oxidoreductase subunit J [Actinomycetota bacterium]